jgi:hypothetical protein
MLITFKSDAGADVLMLGDTAGKLLTILGKDPGDSKGIVTTGQLPDAIAQLKAAIETERARQNAQTAAARANAEEAAHEAGRSGMNANVSLAQRAWPLLELLERSQAENVPVVWGV